jgi:hypothetical protein
MHANVAFVNVNVAPRHVQCINLLLTLLFFIPGVIHAWMVVLDHRAGLQPIAKMAGPAAAEA